MTKLISLSLVLLTVLFTQNLNAQIDPEHYYTPDELFELGAEAYVAEEYVKAYDHFMKVHPNDTAYFDARRRAVECAESEKRYDTIIEVCTGVIDMKRFNPYREEFLVAKASALIGKEKNDEALKFISESSKEFPRSSRLLYQLARVHYRMENYDEAVVDLQNAIRYNPRYFGAHWFLGKICAEAGYYTKAALSFNMAAFINASSPSGLQAIGFLEDVYGGNVENKIEKLNFAEDESFDEIDLMIKNNIALNKGYKVKCKLTFNFVKHNHLIFERMQYDSGDKGFWSQNYVRFFKEVFNKKDFANFSYFQCISLEDPDVQRTITKYKTKILAFVNWGAPYLTECFNDRTFPENGDYVENNLRHIGSYGFDEEGENVDGKRTGHFIGYDENGIKNAEGDYNSEGNVHGTWEYFEDGVKTLQVDFNNGKLEGDRISYYGNGSRNKLIPIKDDHIDGSIKSYFGCNQIYSEVPFSAEGDEDGEAVYYYSTGEVSNRINYKDGQADGKYTEFHRNGQVREEVNYVEGKKQGALKAYHANGQLHIEGQYVDNEATGQWKYFFDNGQLGEEGEFKKGLRVGIWKEYNRFGILDNETNYGETGKKTGIYKSYDLDGNLILELEYKGEEVIKYTTYDAEGKVLSQAEKKKRELEFVDFHDNGAKRVEGKYYKGNQVGSWKFYNLQGTLIKELNYNDEGLLDGKSNWYFDNGEIETIKNFVEGQLDGYYVDYYRHGKIFKHGWYKEGQRVGQWDEFYKDGSLANTSYYLEGEVHGDMTFFDEKGNIDEVSTYFYGLYMSSTTFDTLNNENYHVDIVDGSASADFLGQGGKVTTKKSFKGGHSHGPIKGYYAGGSLKYEGAYVAGSQDGDWKWYRRDGKLWSEGTYELGIKVGKWSWYHENGKLDIEENYISGNREGKVLRYYDNGQLRSEKNYRNDERHGTWTYYDPFGEVKYIRYYDDGFMLGYSYLGSDGKPVEMIPFDKMNGTIEAYFKNGKKSYVSEYKDGYSHGKTTHYYSNGKVHTERTYYKDLLHGVYKEFYANGKPKEESNYEYGDATGSYTRYYENGKKEYVENYINDDLYGWAEYYSSTGALKEKAYYYNDRKIK